MNTSNEARPRFFIEKHWHSVCLAMLLLVGASSCTSAFDEEQVVATGTPISFATSTWDATTKVAVMDGDHFSSFSVNATTGNSKFEFMLNTSVVRTVPATDNKWTYAPVKHYPTNGSTVYFYAYSPLGSVNVQKITTTSDGKSAFVTYKVPLNTDAATEKIQEDFLVASGTGNKDTSTLNLTFYHALAHLSFEATNSTGADVVITTIQLLYLDREGVVALPLTFGGVANWSANTDYTSVYQASMPVTGVLVTNKTTLNLTSPNDGLAILPQDLKDRLDGSGVPTADGGYPEDAGPEHTTQASYLAVTYHTSTKPEATLVKYISLNGWVFANKSYLLQFTLNP